jgi:hypothetical protein
MVHQHSQFQPYVVRPKSAIGKHVMNRLNVDLAPEGERNAPHVVARQQRFHFLA